MTAQHWTSGPYRIQEEKAAPRPSDAHAYEAPTFRIWGIISPPNKG